MDLTFNPNPESDGAGAPSSAIGFGAVLALLSWFPYVAFVAHGLNAPAANVVPNVAAQEPYWIAGSVLMLVIGLALIVLGIYRFRRASDERRSRLRLADDAGSVTNQLLASSFAVMIVAVVLVFMFTSGNSVLNAVALLLLALGVSVFTIWGVFSGSFAAMIGSRSGVQIDKGAVAADTRLALTVHAPTIIVGALIALSVVTGIVSIIIGSTS